MVNCLSEIAQYVYDKHGKFSDTIPTMVLPGYVQAQHIDTEYHDTHFQTGAYLETHALKGRREEAQTAFNSSAPDWTLGRTLRTFKRAAFREIYRRLCLHPCTSGSWTTFASRVTASR